MSPTQETAVIPAASLTTAGTDQVTVVTPNEATTSPQTFTVTQAPDTLTSISPNSAVAGSGNTTITLTGTNFLPTSVAQFNGTAIATTYVSPTQLTAVIPAASLTTAGTDPVTVVTPNEAATAAQTFTVTAAPAPTLTGVSPASAPAGSGATTVTLTGTNFTAGSVVDFNGTPVATTFVSPTQVTAVIPAADLTTAGTDPITVTTPNQPTTAAVTFTVTPAATTPPQVVQVYANSTAWSSTFQDYVDNGFADPAALGYPIPHGGEQEQTLPWVNVNQLKVTFSQDVGASLSLAAFSVTPTAGFTAVGNAAPAMPTLTGYTYDPTTFTATLNFSGVLPASVFDLKVSSAAVSNASGQALDGEFVNGVTTGNSGNGVAGGDFSFRVFVLPGDTVDTTTDRRGHPDRQRGRRPGGAGDAERADLRHLRGARVRRAGRPGRQRRHQRRRQPAGPEPAERPDLPVRRGSDRRPVAPVATGTAVAKPAASRLPRSHSRPSRSTRACSTSSRSRPRPPAGLAASLTAANGRRAVTAPGPRVAEIDPRAADAKGANWAATPGGGPDGRPGPTPHVAGGPDRSGPERLTGSNFPCSTSASSCAAPPRSSPSVRPSRSVPASADAAVVLTMSNVAVPAGSPALVGVFAASTTGDVISGFNLPTDINDDGFVSNGTGTTASKLPAGFALDATPTPNAVYVNTGFDQPYPQIALINVDGIATGSGNNITLTATPTLLYDLAIDVGRTVTGGTVVPLEIEVPAAPFSPLFDVAGPNTPTVTAPAAGAPVFGSITVTAAVPEPSAACLLAVSAVASALHRRSRR